MAVSDHGALSTDEAAILARVAQDAEVSTMIALAQRFAALLRG
ncbi:hypothetical protein QMO56_26100 [Roseomonas sp. E05]|nr:hypothetical protein [Roseomonas sp. E05]MDJ0391581.1 hypothetical protein [Roseomonas sp. E05]